MSNNGNDVDSVDSAPAEGFVYDRHGDAAGNKSRGGRRGGGSGEGGGGLASKRRKILGEKRYDRQYEAALENVVFSDLKAARFDEKKFEDDEDDDILAFLNKSSGRSIIVQDEKNDAEEEDEQDDDEERDEDDDEEEETKKGGLRPAWKDEDDDDVLVDISSINRLRKLRKSEEETTITGVELEKRLRTQFEKTSGSVDVSWAKIEKDDDDGSDDDDDDDGSVSPNCF